MERIHALIRRLTAQLRIPSVSLLCCYFWKEEGGGSCYLATRRPMDGRGPCNRRESGYRISLLTQCCTFDFQLDFIYSLSLLCLELVGHIGQHRTSLKVSPSNNYFCWEGCCELMNKDGKFSSLIGSLINMQADEY